MFVMRAVSLWSNTGVGQTNIVLTSRQGLIRGRGARSLTLTNLIPRRSHLAREDVGMTSQVGISPWLTQVSSSQKVRD